MADGQSQQSGSSITVSLPKISLPPGLSSDDLARLVTEVLLRKAYNHPSAWAQWLCVAALEILHGKAAPKLDAKLLHLLQDLQAEEYSSEDKSVSPENVSTKHVSPKTGHKSVKKGTSKSRDNLKRGKHSKLFSDKVNNADLIRGTKSEGTFASRSVTDDNVSTPVLPKVNKGIQVGKLPVTSVSDSSVQVTPRLMHMLCTKWTQVRKPLGKPEETQTEDHLVDAEGTRAETKDAASQTLQRKHPPRLRRNTCNKETQTILIYQKHTGTQTGQELNTLKPKWKLIPVSGLPKKRKVRRERCDSGGHFIPVNQNKFLTPSDDLTSLSAEKSVNSIENTVDLSPLKDTAEPAQGKGHRLNNGNKVPIEVEVFHGRALIEPKSTMEPVLIPLEHVNSLARLMVVDPRE